MEKHQKNQEQINAQLDGLEAVTENEITPVALREDVHKLSAEELKKLYPERYRLYVELLRELKKPEGITEEDSLVNLAIKAHSLTALDEMIHYKESGDMETLFKRQQETLSKISQTFERGINRGYVSLPTGVGKTVIFAKLIKAYTSHPNSKVLVVAPTKTILNQNDWKIETHGGQTSGKFYGGDKEQGEQVTLTTFASFMRNADELDLESYDLIILDESHRALSDARVEKINSLKRPTIIGFTATPEFHENKRLEDILDYEIDTMTIKEAVEEGLLSSMKVYLVRTQTEIEVERAGKDYDLEALTKSIDTPLRNELVVNTYKSSPVLEGRKAVAYCTTRDHARRIAQKFNDEGITAAYVGGDLKDEEREELLKQFRQGELMVLCNADLLIEGFDAEEAEVCLNVTPTISKVVAEQRGGRVLRRDPKNGRKVGKVVEFVDDWKETGEKPILFSEVAKAAEITSSNVTFGKPGPDDIREIKSSTMRTPPEKGPAILESDPELIMSVTRKFKAERFIQKYEYAPLLWSNARNISQETSTRENSIVAFAERYKVEHPEWFNACLTAHNRLTIHYSPELINLIRKEFLTELRGKINTYEFSQKQHIDISHVRDLFVLVLEEKKGVACLSVGGDVYIDEKAFTEWYERKGKAKELRIERKERKATNELLEDETNPRAEEAFMEATDDSASFTREGDPFDQSEPIDDSDAVSEDEREAYRKMLIDLEDGEVEDELGATINIKEVLKIMGELEEKHSRPMLAVRLTILDGLTLENASSHFGVTRERVRGLRVEGLRLIRTALNRTPIDPDIVEKGMQVSIFKSSLIANMEDLVIKNRSLYGKLYTTLGGKLDPQPAKLVEQYDCIKNVIDILSKIQKRVGLLSLMLSINVQETQQKINRSVEELISNYYGVSDWKEAEKTFMRIWIEIAEQVKSLHPHN